MRRNMLESLQGRGLPREFVISRRSGNVTLVPSWRSQLDQYMWRSGHFMQFSSMISWIVLRLRADLFSLTLGRQLFVMNIKYTRLWKTWQNWL